MGQHIRWQAIITVTGIAMTLTFLTFLAFVGGLRKSPMEDSARAEAERMAGGHYIEGVIGRPQFINPLLAQFNPVDQDLVALIFNGLLRSDGQGELAPNLATEWGVSSDGLSYVFDLRQDVQWQDGRPFTADDVLFTMGLMQDPDFPGNPELAALWQSISVLKLEEYKVRFVLETPLPNFIDYLTLGILPAHQLENVAPADLLDMPFNLEPIGTGPFILESINAEFARLTPNPLYFEAPPRLNGLTLRFYPSYQTVMAAYQTGAVLGGHIPTEGLPVAQNMASLQLYNARLPHLTLIYLNLQAPDTVPFFQDTELRQALLYGLNRQQIINDTLHGQGLIANGPILPWSWAYNPQQVPVTTDLERSANLLARLGWADTDGDGILDQDGRPLAFTLLTSDDPIKIEVAQVISEQWRQLGVDVTVEPLGVALGGALREREFEAALVEIAIPGDPDPYPLWHNSQIENGQNFTGWENRRVARLLREARNNTNQGRRSDMYYTFQQLFAEELPAIMLYIPIYNYGVDERVQGVQLAPLRKASDRFRNITEWYVIPDQPPEQQP